MPGVAMSSMRWKYGGVDGEDDHLEVVRGRLSIQWHSKCLPDSIPFALYVILVELSNCAKSVDSRAVTWLVEATRWSKR
jgi:hypothetical protein